MPINRRFIQKQINPAIMAHNTKHSVLILSATVASIIAMAPKAEAQLGIPNFPFDLRYEQDPDGAGPITIGSPFRGGIQIFVEGLDSGTLYNAGPGVDLNPGLGGIQNNTGPTNAGSVAALNALTFRQAPSSVGGDDTWGIGFITRIVDPVTNANVWTPLGKNQQITGMFYGAQDVFLGTTGTSQTIGSKGFTLDLYLQQGQNPIPSFAGVLPASRAGLSAFPNFTNPPLPTNGASSLQLLARFNSTNGFLDPGSAFGVNASDTEFLAQFTASSGAQGSAQGFANVDNTVGQLQGPGGPSIFENNSFSGATTGVDLDPVTPGIQNNRFADAQFVFSTQTLPGFDQPNRWTVSVAGPILTNVIPEPSTALFGLACVLPALVRRKKKVAAV